MVLFKFRKRGDGNLTTKTEGDFTGSTRILFERSLAIEGFPYLVIYGEHVNGGFICIPNKNIGCEAATFPDSQDYNEEKMTKAGLKESAAREIADYIDAFIKGNEK